MPEDRLIHRAALRGTRVGVKLTDFERNVWLAYELCADDYGVMRFTAQSVQEAIWLEKRSRRQVLTGLERVRDVELVHTFEHQHETFCYQRDWNKFQKVRHPRTTINPCPPRDELLKCDRPTQQLFRQHPNFGKVSETLPEDFGKVSETLPSLARAGTRETATANANGNGSEALARAFLDPADFTPDEQARATRFLAKYAEFYAKYRHGATYVGKPQADLLEALLLVRAFDDARLELLVEAFFTTDEPFCRNGTGSVAQFRSRASWCDSKLKAAGL